MAFSSRELQEGAPAPQGGILSPFLWNLTLNDLLLHIKFDYSFVQAFANNLAIVVGGIDIPTIRAICQSYLKIINSWCTSTGVKLSVLKTQANMFTRKRKWSLDRPLSGNPVHLVTSVKYLGITIDSKILWKLHIEAACNKAIRSLHAVRSACCKKRGLKHIYTRCIYRHHHPSYFPRLYCMETPTGLQHLSLHTSIPCSSLFPENCCFQHSF